MSRSGQEFRVHPDPVWRERSNFVIHGELPGTDHLYRYEQLRVRQIDRLHFEICCIPFFIYDLNLEDVVQTVAKDGLKYVVDRGTRQSGRYTFRVWLGNSIHQRDEIARELGALGALLEWSSRNLLAVDAADATQAQAIADRLAAYEASGCLEYETGRL